MRHLHGLSLRNCNVTSRSSRLRSQIVDDDALPYALKTPEKALRTDEQGLSLKRVSSSGDLQQDEATTLGLKQPPSVHLSVPKTLPRPRGRRRSTIDWRNPKTRRKTVQKDELPGTGTPHEIFFSLHHETSDEPLYVSEVLRDTSNPDFRHFELRSTATTALRSDEVQIKVWIRSPDVSTWQCLLEASIWLQGLIHIGKTLEDYEKSLAQNSLVLYVDGEIYLLPPTNTLLERSAESPVDLRVADQSTQTSSYDSLMRLATLDECINEALETRTKLTAEINNLITSDKDRFSPEANEATGGYFLQKMQRAVELEQRHVAAAKARLRKLQETLQSRRDSILRGRQLPGEFRKKVAQSAEKAYANKGAQQHLEEQINGQRRRICEDLLLIFPIEPIPKQALAFTIRGQPLPNSDFSHVEEDATAAALGNVSRLVSLLSAYLSTSLPYAIEFRGSASSINDPLSMMTGSRNFPLYLKGAVFYRFEYGVFLLNKNIELLASKLGLRSIDIRQTLPNLKYVLYVATAGRGELPARKSGGIRGLLMEKGKRTPEDSRRNSADSTTNVLVETFRRKLLQDGTMSNGNPTSGGGHVM